MNMLQKTIEKIMQHSNGPCVSIILPLVSTDRQYLFESVKQTVREIRSLLTNNAYSASTKEVLERNLDDILILLPPGNSAGIGIFLCPSFTEIIRFPFEVNAYCGINAHFQKRDLMYLHELAVPYHVLALTKDGVHLYEGELDILEEVENNQFPVVPDNDYEYARPGIGTSWGNTMKGFENEKSVTTAHRMAKMVKEADARLALTRGRITTPVVLAGTQKLTALYLENTRLDKNLICTINGSYKPGMHNKLGKAAWEALMKLHDDEVSTVVSSLREKDNGHLAKGIQEAWQAVEEGRGLLLAMEKDFHCPGFARDDNPLDILLREPSGSFKVIPDVTDTILDKAERKNVRIMLVDNDRLKDFGHLALQLRY
jgi:hypothetical protein